MVFPAKNHIYNWQPLNLIFSFDVQSSIFIQYLVAAIFHSYNFQNDGPLYLLWQYWSIFRTCWQMSKTMFLFIVILHVFTSASFSLPFNIIKAFTDIVSSIGVLKHIKYYSSLLASERRFTVRQRSLTSSWSFSISLWNGPRWLQLLFIGPLSFPTRRCFIIVAQSQK